jgi:hypothetical protein
MVSRPVFVNYQKAYCFHPVMSKTTDNGLKRAEKTRSNLLNLSDFLCLTPFSAIFQLNHGNPS